jgi:hypothetical protein
VLRGVDDEWECNVDGGFRDGSEGRVVVEDDFAWALAKTRASSRMTP